MASVLSAQLKRGQSSASITYSHGVRLYYKLLLAANEIYAGMCPAHDHLARWTPAERPRDCFLKVLTCCSKNDYVYAV